MRYYFSNDLSTEIHGLANNDLGENIRNAIVVIIVLCSPPFSCTRPVAINIDSFYPRRFRVNSPFDGFLPPVVML